jgi:hypothetical protein
MDFSPCGGRGLTASLKAGKPEEAVTVKGNQLRNLVAKIADTVSEMNYAQRRMTALRLSLDLYVLEPDEAPATYHEFLTRSSGSLLHEPSASRRAQHGSLK